MRRYSDALTSSLGIELIGEMRFSRYDSNLVGVFAWDHCYGILSDEFLISFRLNDFGM